MRFPDLSKISTFSSDLSTVFRSDILAGITVAAYLIPQCMAYGELAGVSPIAGLWAILPPLFLYTWLGSSRQLSVGPESSTALLTAATIAPLATNETYAGLAALLALLVGSICLVGYIARLGFLANLLSQPILIGYMTGVAILMMVGQLSNVTHLSLKSTSIWGIVSELAGKLIQIHLPTLMLAGSTLAFLYLMQRLAPKVPAPLVAVLLATAAGATFHLEQLGVAVVGQIPVGFPHFVLPPLTIEHIQALIVPAVGIAVVGYSDNVLTARAFARHNGYVIDAQQELLALGCCNLGNGLMQGFPISSSGSRTAIGDSLGSKTQLFSVVALGVVVFVLLFLRPVLAQFPKAALGALVIYAASRLIEIPEFKKLYRFRLSEFGLALTTTMGVLFTDIIIGVLVAIGLSLIDLLLRVVRPTDAILGSSVELDLFDDVRTNARVSMIPGLLIYRYDAPLCFANAEDFLQRALAVVSSAQPPGQWFILNAEAITSVDMTASSMLLDLQREMTDRGLIFGFVNLKPSVAEALHKSGFWAENSSARVFSCLPTVVQKYNVYSQKT